MEGEALCMWLPPPPPMAPPPPPLLYGTLPPPYPPPLLDGQAPPLNCGEISMKIALFCT